MINYDRYKYCTRQKFCKIKISQTAHALYCNKSLILPSDCVKPTLMLGTMYVWKYLQKKFSPMTCVGEIGKNFNIKRFSVNRLAHVNWAVSNHIWDWSSTVNREILVLKIFRVTNFHFCRRWPLTVYVNVMHVYAFKFCVFNSHS